MRKIYKFSPIYKTAIWGGDRIAPFKGEPPVDANVGESWEISAVKGDESVVADGEEAGTPLSVLIDRYGRMLVGQAVYDKFGSEFPLLIKFIDAHKDLSIQVHPDDDLSMKRHGKRGKTEMWYVIETRKDARLLSGLKRSVTPREYEEAVKNHTIGSLLCNYDVKPGDVFFLPAGRIHSIGAGTFLAEIQETSDVTYRIYDFNRRDSTGKLRELHTALAVDAIDYKVLDNYRTQYKLSPDSPATIAECSHFKVNLLDLTRRYTADVSDRDDFMVIMVIDGEVTIHADEDTRHCHRGETVLVAAATSGLTIDPAGNAKVLIATA